jgi:hypothetical protein
MEKQKHTQEPWETAERRIIERPVRVMEHFAIAPQHGPTFAFLPAGRESSRTIQSANAERIVACVNALAGKNPDAIADVVVALAWLVEQVAEPIHEHSDYARRYEQARAALAKLREVK